MSDQCSTSSGSTKEVGEIVGKGVELEAHRVADVLRLQQLLGLSQRRIGAEMEIDAPLGVAANHRWDKIVRAFTRRRN